MISLTDTLYTIARALVSSPDEVTVTGYESGKNVNLVLSVAPDDMGMVIGKHGKIAKAIRNVMKAAANSNGQKVNVEIK